MLFYVRDRKNFNLKKSIDVVQKQNLVPNPIAKETCFSVTRCQKETIQNGSVEKSFNVAVASASATKNNVLEVALTKDILSKEASAPKNGRFTSECLALKNSPTSKPSPDVTLSKQRVSRSPILNPTPKTFISPPAPSVKGSGINNIDNVVANSTGEGEISKKDDGILDAIQANIINSQNSAADKPHLENASLKVLGSSISLHRIYMIWCTLHVIYNLSIWLFSG